MAFDSPYTSEYPNENVYADKGKVTAAVITAWIFGVLNVLVGLGMMFSPESFIQGPGDLEGSETLKAVFFVVGFISIAWGATYIILAIFIQKNSVGCAKAAFILGAIELGFAFLSINLIGILINGLKFWLLKRGHAALAMIVARVDASEQSNALTSYYHSFIPLLVTVANADGKVDASELNVINILSPVEITSSGTSVP